MGLVWGISGGRVEGRFGLGVDFGRSLEGGAHAFLSQGKVEELESIIVTGGPMELFVCVRPRGAQQRPGSQASGLISHCAGSCGMVQSSF